jgi:hypothetical protein
MIRPPASRPAHRSPRLLFGFDGSGLKLPSPNPIKGIRNGYGIALSLLEERQRKGDVPRY